MTCGRSWRGVLDTTLCDKVCQWLAAGHGEVYSIQHYVIKFVSDLRQVGGFFSGTLVSSTNKTNHLVITEILLKVAPTPPIPRPYRLLCMWFVQLSKRMYFPEAAQRIGVTRSISIFPVPYDDCLFQYLQLLCTSYNVSVHFHYDNNQNFHPPF